MADIILHQMVLPRPGVPAHIAGKCQQKQRDDVVAELDQTATQDCLYVTNSWQNQIHFD